MAQVNVEETEVAQKMKRHFETLTETKIEDCKFASPLNACSPYLLAGGLTPLKIMGDVCSPLYYRWTGKVLANLEDTTFGSCSTVAPAVRVLLVGGPTPPPFAVYP